MKKVLHIFKYPPGKGGMDAIQSLHENKADPCETVVALLNRSENIQNAASTRGGVWTSWRSLRKRFTEKIHDATPAISLYYNCWGADVLADLDPAKWRVGYLHSDFPDFSNYIKYYAKYLNCFLCVSEGMASKIRKSLPFEYHKYISVAPIMGTARPQAGKVNSREFVIGYAGRLVLEQKRLDRLPVFIKKLDTAGISNWRLEVLGEGPFREKLETMVSKDTRIQFLGWRDSETTRKHMETWRYQITFSDYEGLSIALLEAAAAGCIPIYPNFGEEQEPADLPVEAAKYCLYRKGDESAAAHKIVEWETFLNESSSQVIVAREALIQFGTERTPDRYLKFWAEWRDGLISRMPSENHRVQVKPDLWQRNQLVWMYNRKYKKLVRGYSYQSFG